MQDHQPIAYFRKALSHGTLSKSVYEEEIMALALSGQHWKHYLLERSFEVYTGHKSLALATTTSHNNRPAMLVVQINEVPIWGPLQTWSWEQENKAADDLSRKSTDIELNTISVYPYWVDFPKLRGGE